MKATTDVAPSWHRFLGAPAPLLLSALSAFFAWQAYLRLTAPPIIPTFIQQQSALTADGLHDATLRIVNNPLGLPVRLDALSAITPGVLLLPAPNNCDGSCLPRADSPPSRLPLNVTALSANPLDVHFLFSVPETARSDSPRVVELTLEMTVLDDVPWRLMQKQRFVLVPQ